MLLIGDSFPDVQDATLEDLHRVFSAAVTLNYSCLVLDESEDKFLLGYIEPDPDEKFRRLHDSEPWGLQYRDPASGKTFCHPDFLTLEQMGEAFVSYLTGGVDWQNFVWVEVRPGQD